MVSIKKKIQELLSKGNEIKAVEQQFDHFGDSMGVEGKMTDKWLNDVLILSSKLPDGHPLIEQIKKTYNHRGMASTFSKMYSYLESLRDDENLENETMPNEKRQNNLKYDVFLSHANSDKIELVDKIFEALDKLGINIFYDKDTLEWGDHWKERILEGTAESEFAIIVISENFFGREWTEKELKEFLKRERNDGQKLILPILHKVTVEQVGEKYETLTDIQFINSADYSPNDIALLFARQLIKRLKEQ